MLRRPERYKTLLRVRKREEDARAMALSRAAQAVFDAEDRRSSLVQRHEDAMVRAKQAASGTDVRAMEQLTLYERHLTQVIGRTDRDISRLRSEQRTKRKEFDDSHRKRRMIEMIMLRAGENWRTHRDREERKFVEDTVSMRYATRRIPRGDHECEL